MSQSFGTTASMARITSRGSSSPGAMSNGIASAGSVAMRCASSFERMAAAVGLPTPNFFSRARQDGLAAGAGIRSDVDVGGLLPVAQAARGIVQLDLAGFSPPGPAADVVGQAGGDREPAGGGPVHVPPH